MKRLFFSLFLLNTIYAQNVQSTRITLNLAMEACDSASYGFCSGYEQVFRFRQGFIGMEYNLIKKNYQNGYYVVPDSLYTPLMLLLNRMTNKTICLVKNNNSYERKVSSYRKKNSVLSVVPTKLYFEIYTLDFEIIPIPDKKVTIPSMGVGCKLYTSISCKAFRITKIHSISICDKVKWSPHL